MRYKDYKYTKLNDYNSDVINEALNNTYKILFEDWTIDELLDIGAQHFLINPDIVEIPIDIIETMLLYYEGEEAYEKCSKIKTVLDKFKTKAND